MARKWLGWVRGKTSRMRAAAQAVFLFIWLDPLLLRLHNVCGSVFHCYSCPLATFACPIGVLANFSALHVFPFMAMGVLVLGGALVGALFCGWACPFGFLQDGIARIPTPKFRLPRWTGHFRYAVLVGLVLAVPFFFGSAHPLFICRICPAGALEGAAPYMVRAALAGQQVAWPNALKLGIVALVGMGMFFTWRPWCRLLCPLGAIYGLLNRTSVLSLNFDAEGCNDCGRCARECRYGVLPQKDAGDSRCVRCFECTECDALSIGTVFSGGRSAVPGEGRGSG